MFTHFKMNWAKLWYSWINSIFTRLIKSQKDERRKAMIGVLLFIGGLGGWEILLILMVLLIFFGAKRIPELARGLGKGIREFKDATREIKNEIEEGTKDEKK